MPDSLPQLGPKGDSGAPGPAGPKGDTGEPGAKGEPGIAFLSGNLTPPITPFAAGSEEPVTLERASRLLVHGVLDASSFTCAAAAPASCKVQVLPIVDDRAQPTSLTTLVIAPGQTKSFAPGTNLLAVTNELPAGRHEVAIGLAVTGQFSDVAASFGSRQFLAVS